MRESIFIAQNFFYKFLIFSSNSFSYLFLKRYTLKEHQEKVALYGKKCRLDKMFKEKDLNIHTIRLLNLI